MYLHCLTKNLNNPKLINNLAKDYELNKNNKLYASYMNQFLGSHMTGERLMVCENLFRLYGTSSEEIAENAPEQERNLFLPQIEKLTDTIDNLTLEKNLWISENDRLKLILKQHNIAYYPLTPTSFIKMGAFDYPISILYLLNNSLLIHRRQILGIYFTFHVR